MAEVFSVGRRRAIFAAAGLGYVLSQFFRSFLTVIADELARDLGAGPQDLGAMGSAWFLTFAAAQFLVGILLDKVGPRRSVAGMMLFAVLGAVLFSQAGSVTMGIVAMALIGLGCSPILMGALYVFAKTEDPARFAMLGSVFLSVGLIGSLLAATPLAVLVAAFGWRIVLFVLAGVTLVSLLLIAVVMRDPPQEEVQPGVDQSLFGALITLLKLPALWPILFMSVFITAEVFTERALWIGPYLGAVHGLDLVARGHAILAFAIAMTLSASLAGPLAKRLDNPKRVVLVGSGMAGFGFLALGLWPAMPLVPAMLVLCLIGLFGVTFAVMLAHARLFMPGHVIGRGITFANFLSIGGTGVVQYASGAAIAGMQRTGYSTIETYGLLHLAFGVTLLVAACVYAFAPERPSA